MYHGVAGATTTYALGALLLDAAIRESACAIGTPDPGTRRRPTSARDFSAESYSPAASC